MDGRDDLQDGLEVLHSRGLLLCDPALDQGLSPGHSHQQRGGFAVTKGRRGGRGEGPEHYLPALPSFARRLCQSTGHLLQVGISVAYGRGWGQSELPRRGVLLAACRCDVDSEELRRRPAVSDAGAVVHRHSAAEWA